MSKIVKYSVNRARAAAMNFKFNIVYEVEKPPARHPIRGPRGVSVMNENGRRLVYYSVNHAWAAAVIINIDYEVKNLPRDTLSEGRRG
jgi:hypothetical protein